MRGVYETGGEGGCKSYSMDSLLLSKRTRERGGEESGDSEYSVDREGGGLKVTLVKKTELQKRVRTMEWRERVEQKKRENKK
jgi:hypothetical protein